MYPIFNHKTIDLTKNNSCQENEFMNLRRLRSFSEDLTRENNDIHGHCNKKFIGIDNQKGEEKKKKTEAFKIHEVDLEGKRKRIQTNVLKFNFHIGGGGEILRFGLVKS